MHSDGDKNKGRAGGEVGHRSFSLEAQGCLRGRLGCGGNSPAQAQEARHAGEVKLSKPPAPEAVEVGIKETNVNHHFLSLFLGCMHFL